MLTYTDADGTRKATSHVTGETVTIGQLNTDTGKAFAEAFRKSSLLEMAEWCVHAEKGLAGMRGQGSIADAALFYDFQCLLRQMAKHAA